MQSLTDGVDLEDLGMHCMDKTMQEHKDISLPKDTVFPTWLEEYNQVTSLLWGCHCCMLPQPLLS